MSSLIASDRHSRGLIVREGIDLDNLTLRGSFTVTPRVILSGASATLAATDHIVLIKKSTGSATAITLPVTTTENSASGTTVSQVYMIKDAKGDSDSNPITITPASGTVDGASTAVINTPYGSLTLVSDGSDWYVI